MRLDMNIFQIAAKYAANLMGIATPEEREALENWNQESVWHTNLAERLDQEEDFKANQQLLERFSVTEAWKKMEKNLDKIESGKADWHKTVDDFYQGFAASLEQAEKNMEGKKVKVHYTGTLDDGTKFDSSVDRGEPIEFVCMAGQMIPGFDAAVEDMAVGEKKTVHIPAAEAYGERDDAMVQKVPVDQIPNADQLPVGQTVYMMGPGGQPFPVFVQSIEDGIVTFDMNHELAGKDLNFDIELVEVED